MTDDYPSAVESLKEALEIYRDLGDRQGQANALRYLGAARRLTGDYSSAAESHEEALGIYGDLRDRQGESEVLNETGTLHRVRGDLSRARECQLRALNLAREIVSSTDQARALAELGRCALALGNSDSAEANLRQALEIFPPDRRDRSRRCDRRTRHPHQQPPRTALSFGSGATGIMQRHPPKFVTASR